MVPLITQGRVEVLCSIEILPASAIERPERGVHPRVVRRQRLRFLEALPGALEVAQAGVDEPEGQVEQLAAVALRLEPLDLAFQLARRGLALARVALEQGRRGENVGADIAALDGGLEV